MRSADELRLVVSDGRHVNGGPSAAYSNGVTDGESARVLRSPITIYLEVGIDDYAMGFRAGFFRGSR